MLSQKPSGVEKPFFNSALCFYRKKQIFQYDKRLLPTYDVFDERRYFERGTSSSFLEIEGLKIGVTICEDMWQHLHNLGSVCYNQDPIHDLKNQKLDLVVNISGSPFYQNKIGIRKQIVHSITQELNCPMIYTNQVGANDAIIFDGYSMFMSKTGEVDFLKGFKEDLRIIDIFHHHALPLPSFENDLEEALKVGIRDYVHKNGFRQVVLGLSGGIDSALVLALCVDALGPKNVKAIYMPSPHSRAISLELATRLAMNFDVSLDVVEIHRIMHSYVEALEDQLTLSKGGIAFENIQSRIRGNIIMAYANKHAALMMGCSNKSELAVGYGTLYGDIAGSLLPIGDLLKVDVYKLAHHMSRGRIPDQVFTRAPSAELYMNQQDTDTLPPYEILDPIIKLFVEGGKSREDIMAHHPDFVPHLGQILHLLKVSEFKRYQAPMILKVSKRNFGTGWDQPLTRK